MRPTKSVAGAHGGKLRTSGRLAELSTVNPEVPGDRFNKDMPMCIWATRQAFSSADLTLPQILHD